MTQSVEIPKREVMATDLIEGDTEMRHYPVVVLRDDQIELIARRVAELLRGDA